MALRVSQGRVIETASNVKYNVQLQDILREEQVRDQWCWVACILMVLVRSASIDQCEIAQKNFPKLRCCENPDACNIALEPAKVEELWGKCGFLHVDRHCGILTIKEILRELEAGRPVEIWLGELEDCDEFTGSGHVVLITGIYEDLQGAVTLTVRDSNPNDLLKEASYLDLEKNPTSYGPWVGSWTGIGKRRPT